MLSNTLNTNEIKNASGVEIEFEHLEQKDRTRVFHKINESPALPHRLTISHSEVGSGMKRRRRSVVRFDYTSISDVDTLTPVTSSAYCVLDQPVGAITDSDDPKLVLANLMSFLASLGASTTILYDCTGNGASVLIGGGL